MRNLCSNCILPRLPAIINFNALIPFFYFLCSDGNSPKAEGQKMNRYNGYRKLPKNKWHKNGKSPTTKRMKTGFALMKPFALLTNEVGGAAA